MARQAGLVHPLDWVRLYEAHTPHEWAVQVALSQVEPWGDDRADLREARMAAHLIASNRIEPMDDDAFSELLQALARYLRIHEEPEQVVGSRALRQAMGET